MPARKKAEKTPISRKKATPKPRKVARVEEHAKHAGGRPSKFKPVFNEEATKLCKLGFNDAMLAVFFETTEQTINNWKIKYPEFFEALKRGKLEADTSTGVKLYERAQGAEYLEQQAFKCKTVHYDDNGKKVMEKEDIKIVEVRRRAPPDTTALIFWLKNRQKELWRDNREVTGKDGAPLLPPGNASLPLLGGLEQLINLDTQMNLVEQLADGHFDAFTTGNDPRTVPETAEPEPPGENGIAGTGGAGAQNKGAAEPE